MTGSEPSTSSSLQRSWDRDRFVFLADVAIALLRRKWLVIGVPLLMGTLAFLFFLLRGSYRAESSFTPEESGSSLAQFASLAARFGAAVPGLSGRSQSLDFYARVITSPALLEEVVTTRFHVAKEPGGSDSVSGTLLDLYGVEGDTPSDRLREGIKRLQGRIAVSSDRLANVVTINVKAPYPELAQAINRRILDVLNTFNLQQRQTAARAQRVFAEERVAEARAELNAAEREMQQFLETNRSGTTSPRLVFEAARLQRRIDVRQQVYSSLVQAFEQSRIEEVRDTPVFTVIQRPELYTQRSRNPLIMGAFAFFFFLAITVAIALFLEYLANEWRSHPEKYARLEEVAGSIRKLRFWGGAGRAARR